MEQQQQTISHLTKENELAKSKIKKLRDIKKTSNTKQTKITPFVTPQMNPSDSDSDVQEVEIHKPDSTQLKVVQGSDSGSEDVTSAQATQKKKKQVCIESISTVDQ